NPAFFMHLQSVRVSKFERSTPDAKYLASRTRIIRVIDWWNDNTITAGSACAFAKGRVISKSGLTLSRIKNLNSGLNGTDIGEIHRCHPLVM
ncbi:MAG: hypothetical protein V4719_14050, partial [Planctomycetota bacterium]